MGEHLRELTPDGVQHLLARADWDANAVRGDLGRYLAEHLGDAAGVLIVDETGFLMKGAKSCGVARKPETIGIGGALRPSTGLKESPFAPVAPRTPFPSPPPAVPGPGGLTSIPPTGGDVIPPTSSYKLKDSTDAAATILPGPRVQPIQPVKGPVGEK